ncbi:MAG: N-acetyl-D-Glu racemase DgcA [Photobacterium frigidiphilum]|uniref:N-acetyl-D-Glu racemase DgcA n=1 Tax=Photobacterium frigidiphilum TaxID=264736 RepID=UPI003002F237
MKITAIHEQFPLARSFTISRGSRTHVDVVKVTIEHKGIIAEGECTPYARYGETVESVIEQIKYVASHAEDQSNLHQSLPQLLSAGAARNAIDCALWRLEQRQKGIEFPKQSFDIKSNIITAMTVSIDTPEVMAEQAKEYCELGAKLLKVKLDSEQILERVKTIREAIQGIAPDTKIILDANEAWGELDLKVIFSQLAELNIAMIEQPVAKGEDNKLLGIPHPVPLCADESCHTSQDLALLLGCYEMVNIKLDKTGGLTEALTLESKAIEMGFTIMMGCMLGTSLAMEAALPIAARAEIVDLDGPVLLIHDRKNGLRYQSGHIVI